MPEPLAPALVGLGLALFPAEAPEAFAAQAARSGAHPTARVAACTPFGEDLARCLTVQDGGQRRIAHAGDLAARGLSRGEAEQRLAAARLAEALDALRPSAHPEVAGPFFARAEGDGLDGLLTVDPAALIARVGAPLRVAFPTRNTVLAWAGGDAARDHILAAAARAAWEQDALFASPRVYTWTGEEWAVWGEVKPSGTR